MIDQHDAPGCQHSELAAGWALRALEPAEEILVAAHLSDCSECTRTAPRPSWSAPPWACPSPRRSRVPNWSSGCSRSRPLPRPRR